MWCSVKFRNRICSGVLYVRGGSCWRFDRCSHGNSVKFVASLCSVFGELGTICYGFSFPSATGDVLFFSGAGHVSTEADVRHKRRRKYAVITRRFVPLSGQEPDPVEFGIREWSRELLEQVFDDGNDEFKSGYFRFGSLWFLISVNCLDHFPVDPALAPFRATGHQLVKLSRSICAEERERIMDALMGSKYLTTYLITFVAFFSSLYFPVHRIRCRSSTIGTGRCTFWSTCC